MSGHGSAQKGLATRAVQLLALVTSFGVLFALTKLTPELESRLGTMTAIGFLVLAGTLLSELLEPLRLPHLSGYLLAGIIGGPHVLHLVDHHTVLELSPVNTLALSLIALAGGAELRIETFRSVARGLAWATFIQTTLGFVGAAGGFLAISLY